jgi:hypothetical protein
MRRMRLKIIAFPSQWEGATCGLRSSLVYKAACFLGKTTNGR